MSNHIRIIGTEAIVEMANDYEAVLLTAHLNRISGAHWWPCEKPSGVYAYADVPRRYWGKRAKVAMHQLIVGTIGTGREVDHINHDTLDNRYKNLRVCTKSQNQQNRKNIPKNNTSGFIGVGWHKASGKWRAYITHHRRQIEIGLYGTSEGAARARDSLALAVFGPHAKFNFPKEILK